MKQIDRSYCIYCGNTQDITKDHIPPKCLFLDKRGLQLITVPACQQCNESYKKDDEYFRIFVAADISRNAQGSRLWYQKVIGSTFVRSPNLLNRLTPDKKISYIKKQNGNVSKAIVMIMDLSRIARVVERVTRGLYWHHYKKCLPFDISFEIYPRPPIEGEIKDTILSKTKLHSIGNEEFKYRFRRCDNDEFKSIWGFSFFMGMHFLVITEPKTKN